MHTQVGNEVFCRMFMRVDLIGIGQQTTNWMYSIYWTQLLTQGQWNEWRGFTLLLSALVESLWE